MTPPPDPTGHPGAYDDGYAPPGGRYGHDPRDGHPGGNDGRPGYDDRYATGPRGPRYETPRRHGGIPDSLLIGLLAFLLGLSVLIWTATGLAGLLSHGAWPDGVTYSGTPTALRHLAAEPHDLPGAWPATPKDQLSGYGLFWGLLIGELMVLLVLTLFTLGTLTRYRAVRRARRAERLPGPPKQSPVSPTGPGAQPAPDPSPGTAPGPTPATAPDADTRTGTAPGTPAVPAPVMETAPAPGPGAALGTAAAPLGATAVPGPASASLSSPTGTATPPPTGTAPDASAALGTGGPGIPAAALAATAAATAAPLTTSAAEPALPRLHFGADRRAATAAALAAVTAAPGPVVLATTDPSLWSATKDARAKLGPVLTYDPTHRLDTPSRLRWSPTAGCEDLATATTRAAALLAPVQPHSALDTAVTDAARTLLRCWLHAAAVDGRPFRQLHRWAHATGGTQEPVRILRTDPKCAAGQAGELESVLTAHPERRDHAKELAGRALSALGSVHIRDACNAQRPDALALDSFLDEGGTLYVVGEALEDPRTEPGAMPLLTALLTHVVAHGRRLAARAATGRLDPPLTLVLDDIAALAPLPALPDLLRTDPPRGLLTLATMRSPEQARARWPHADLPL
ncbi:type VI secretion protein [Streptomyces sp. NPDC014733]|uniref:type VI secretion protein n=1 Tax=Streptomyces sp. NPDC014733 TaxID=3364885 RepID=UPI0036FA6E92